MIQQLDNGDRVDQVVEISSQNEPELFSFAEMTFSRESFIVRPEG
jgi:hypothetical protein